MTDRRSHKKRYRPQKSEGISSSTLSVMSTGQNRKKVKNFSHCSRKRHHQSQMQSRPGHPITVQSLSIVVHQLLLCLLFLIAFLKTFMLTKKFRQSKVSYARFCLLNESYSNAINKWMNKSGLWNPISIKSVKSILTTNFVAYRFTLKRRTCVIRWNQTL